MSQIDVIVLLITAFNIYFIFKTKLVFSFSVIKLLKTLVYGFVLIEFWENAQIFSFSKGAQTNVFLLILLLVLYIKIWMTTRSCNSKIC